MQCIARIHLLFIKGPGDIIHWNGAVNVELTGEVSSFRSRSSVWTSERCSRTASATVSARCACPRPSSSDWWASWRHRTPPDPARAARETSSLYTYGLYTQQREKYIHCQNCYRQGLLLCQVSSHSDQGVSFYHANIQTHILHHRDKVIAISARAAVLRRRRGLSEDVGDSVSTVFYTVQARRHLQ